MTVEPATATTRSCDGTSRVTRSLLAYGVIAGPLYFVVALAQALTREGFDMTRHAASLLSNGEMGWIQISNFLLTGAMLIAAAVGIRRTGLVGRWGPRLLGVYGISQIGGGLFLADPTHGFPVGTPAGQGDVSLHGLLHFAVGGVGFIALIAACLVIARRFAAAGDRRWAWTSRVVGVAFLAAFVGIASGSGGSPVVVLAFWAAVALVCGWISAVSTRLYRAV